MSRCPAAPRRVRIDLAYDGTDYAGWQFQGDRRTLQSTLESTLARLQGGRTVRVRAAGRTDAGAHARQQVADCRIATRLEDPELRRALVALLPPDLRPTSVRTVDADFDSQRMAQRKTYIYRIDRTRHGDPFRARFALHHPHAFDPKLLDGPLQNLVGRHDWSGFTDSRCRVENRVREMHESDYVEHDGQGLFLFTADGFLTYMVRNIVGTLLAIAGLRAPGQLVETVLAARDRRLAAATAAAKGLCLWRVAYADDPPDSTTKPAAQALPVP